MIISGLRYFIVLQGDDIVDPPYSTSMDAGFWMKAKPLPAIDQANFSQASGKGVLHGSTDPGVTEMVNALNALSVGALEMAQGSGVQDTELTEVLNNL